MTLDEIGRASGEQLLVRKEELSGQVDDLTSSFERWSPLDFEEVMKELDAVRFELRCRREVRRGAS